MMSPTRNGSNGGTRLCLLPLLPRYARTSLEEQALIYGDETSAHHGTSSSPQVGDPLRRVSGLDRNSGGTDDAITDIVKPARSYAPGSTKSVPGESHGLASY
jgi:hypothetical protein